MRKRICKTILASLLSFTVFFSFNLLPVFAARVTENFDVSRTSKSGAYSDAVSSIDGNADLYSKDFISFQHKGTFGIKSDYSSDKEIVFLLDTNMNGKSKNSAFDYSLFSRNETKELPIKGADVIIKGDIHTNNSLNIQADYFSCTNSEYVVDFIKTTKEDNLKTNRVPSEYIPMAPVYSTLIDPAANKYKIYQFTVDDSLIKVKEKPVEDTNKIQVLMPPNSSITIGSVKVQCNSYVIRNGIKYYQFRTDNEFKIPNETSFSFDGDLKVATSLYFIGKGLLSATGNIDIEGSTLNTSGAQAFIYSETGNISNYTGQIGTTTDSWFYGIMCAPQGTINLQGNSINIRGSIIADNLTSLPRYLTVEYKKIEIPVVEGIAEPPTLFDTAVKTAKDIISRYKIDSIKKSVLDQKGNTVYAKVGILKYNSTANEDGMNNIGLYDLNKYNDADGIKNANDASDALEEIRKFGNDPKNKTIESNLGDGLRRASEILNNSSNKCAAKFIIVFTGNKPNTYTLPAPSDAPDSKYQFCNGNAGTIKTEITTTGTTAKPTPTPTPDYSKSITYAKEVLSKNVIPNNIVPVFINCLPDTDKDFADINACFTNEIVPGVRTSPIINDLLKPATKLYYAPVTATPTTTATPTATPTLKATPTPTATPTSKNTTRKPTTTPSPTLAPTPVATAALTVTSTPTPQTKALPINAATMGTIYSDIIEHITPEVKYIPESIELELNFKAPALVDIVDSPTNSLKNWDKIVWNTDKDKDINDDSDNDNVVCKCTIKYDGTSNTSRIKEESARDTTNPLIVLYSVVFSDINDGIVVKYKIKPKTPLKRYNVPVIFKKSDALLKYTINYKDPRGVRKDSLGNAIVTVPESFTEEYEDLTVNVKYLIDIT